MAMFIIVNIATAQEILKLSVGGSPGLDKGTVVKLSGDGTVAVCDEGEEPVGIIIGLEEDAGRPFYLIASSDMIDNVLLDSDVTAGDQLVPADGGKVQRKDLAPDGFVVGVALVDATAGGRIKIMASFGMGESHNREHSLTSPDDHTDVIVTDLEFGDLLGYDGENWQNFPSSNFSFSDHNHLVTLHEGSDIISAESLFVDGEWNLQLNEDVVGNAELSPIAIFTDVQLDGATRFNITNSDRALDFTAEGGLTITNPSGHNLHFDASGISGEDNQNIITEQGLSGAPFPGTTGDVVLAVDILSAGGLRFDGDGKLAVDFGLGTNQAARGDHGHTNMLTGAGTDGYNAYFTGTNTLAGEQYVSTARGGLGANMLAGAAGAIPVSTTSTTYGVIPAAATGNALISGGTATAPSWGKIRLSGSPTHIEGTLPIGHGGTGLTTLGTSTQLLRVNSGGTALEYWTADYITENQEITLTGHVTGTGRTSIATTISDGVVTNAKLALMPGTSMKGNPSGFPGGAQDIQFTANNQVFGRRDGEIVPINIGSSGGLAWFDHTHEGEWDNYNYWRALPFDGGTAFNVPTTTEVSFYGSGGLKVKRGPGFSLHFDATEVTGTNQIFQLKDGIKGASWGTMADTIDIEIDLMANSGLRFASGRLGVDFDGPGSANTVSRSDHTHEGDFDNYNSWWLFADDGGGDNLEVKSGDLITFQGAGNTTISRSGNTIVIFSSDTSGGSGSEPNQLITTAAGLKDAHYGTRGDIVIEVDLTENGGLAFYGSPNPERTLGADFGDGYNQVARGSHQHEVVFAGDATGTVYIPGTVDLQLSNTGVSSGTYGGSDANIAHIQVDAKGRLTYAGNRTLSAMDIGAASTAHTHDITFSGDATGSATIPGDITLTLSNTGVSAGTYGNVGANIASINVDGKGRITSAANRALTASDVGAASTAHTHTITFAGDLTGSGSVTGTVTANLSNTGVSAGTYGNTGANVASITVDSKGRLSGATNRTLSAGDVGASPAGHQHYHSEILGVGPDDHHARKHHITSTSDHYASPWRLFYSDAAGDIKELTLGPSGQVLTSNGPNAIPTWGEGGGAGGNLWRDATNYIYPNNSETGGDIGTNLRVADTRSQTYGYYASMTGTYGGFFTTSGAGSYGVRAQGVTYGIYAVGATAGYFDGNATITGDLQVGNGTTTGKINCYEIDPAYKIGDDFYSVYGGENIGHRVDLVATGKLSDGEAVIDLTQQKEGTDLWLFSKVVDISTAMVIVTPNGPANLYAYMEGSKLYVKMLSGENDVPFTYRISATRLDKAHQPVHVMNRWRDDEDPLGYIEIDAAGNAHNRYIWDFEEDNPEVDHEE